MTNEIKKFLRENSINETFLYNNRNFLSGFYSLKQYEDNRMFILRYRSLTMNSLK